MTHIAFVIYYQRRIERIFLALIFTPSFHSFDILNLYWDQISLDKIRIALWKEGGKKGYEIVDLGDFEHEINDTIFTLLVPFLH
jgi:hypothetical protein